jgi:exonuclease SbcD
MQPCDVCTFKKDAASHFFAKILAIITLDNTILKILHTSDWHLGQYFYGKNRLNEHQCFLFWLIDVAVKNDVDAIIVAGDIFDTGSPPSYARELYNQFVVSLEKASRKRIKLIVVAGNHDSTLMLDETKSLFTHFNATVLTKPNHSEPKEHLVTIDDVNGELIGLICAVPFLRSRDMVNSVAGQEGKDKRHALQLSIQAFYAKVFSEAKALCCLSGKHLPIVMTGHLTVVGAKSSESVRDIYIGTLDALPASCFPEADYIALGHIHQTQKITSENAIQYCGSPICLSFDELNRSKNILLVECNSLEATKVNEIAVPCFQPMFSLKGNLSELEIELGELASKYRDLKHNNDWATVWVEVEVESQDFLNDLHKRIEHLIEGSCLEILSLKRARKKTQASMTSAKTLSLNELSPLEVFERRIAMEEWTGEPGTKERITHKFSRLVACIHDSNLNEEESE